MKIVIIGDTVQMFGENETRTMSIEQYQRHCRDEKFSAFLPPEDAAAIDKAYVAEVAAALDAAAKLKS